jgi:hypothetical protein
MQTASSKCTGAAAAAAAVTTDGEVAGTCSGNEQLAPAVLQCLAKEVAGVVAPKVSLSVSLINSHMCRVLLLLLLLRSSQRAHVQSACCVHHVAGQPSTRK